MGVFRILDDALGCFGILAASMDVFRGLGDAEGCSKMLWSARLSTDSSIDSSHALRCFEML